MAKQYITVELDDAIIRRLSLLGKPSAVLEHLADSAANGVRRPGQPRRDQTDDSLQCERVKADATVGEWHEAGVNAAAEVVRIARQRADEVVKTARDHADRKHGSQSTATEVISKSDRARADGVLENERSTADALIAHERVMRRNVWYESLAVERGATDKDITTERAYHDRALVDERDANEQLVSAAMLAQSMVDEAGEGTERAEESVRLLNAVAEFREIFIGILAHDLRNPLQAISLNADRLLDCGHLDARVTVSAARIITSTQRMNRMIGQLLDLTRTRLGSGMPIDPKPTDLGEVCRHIIEEFKTAIQLEVEGDVTGTWDSDRLAEALSNLAGNAIEHAAPGTLVMVKAYADGAEVIVEVSNRGAPIPADKLSFIFEPFHQAKQRETSATGNLGLGLYIARQIALSHGGSLDAHSANGTTIFVMRLPRHPPPPRGGPATRLTANSR